MHRCTRATGSRWMERKDIWDGNTEDFAAGPAVKTPSFHCKGHGFNSLSRNQNPTCCQHGKCIKKKKKKYQRIWNLAKELVEWYYDLGILGVPDILKWICEVKAICHVATETLSSRSFSGERKMKCPEGAGHIWHSNRLNVEARMRSQLSSINPEVKKFAKPWNNAILFWKLFFTKILH